MKENTFKCRACMPYIPNEYKLIVLSLRFVYAVRLLWWLNLFTFTFNQKQAIRVRWCWINCWCRCYYRCCGCVQKILIRMLIDMLLLFWAESIFFSRWLTYNERNKLKYALPLTELRPNRIIVHKSEFTAKCQELRGGFNTRTSHKLTNTHSQLHAGKKRVNAQSQWSMGTKSISLRIDFVAKFLISDEWKEQASKNETANGDYSDLTLVVAKMKR